MTVAVVACATTRDQVLPPAPGLVTPVIDLCKDPRQLVGAVGDADALVLLVHPEDIEASGLQAAVRKAGFDPFGVPVLDIRSAASDTGRLRAMVAGASARALAFTGSRPEQARPVMPKEFTRRALLTIPRPYYEAVPLVQSSRCAVADGCRACVDLCPAGAYRRSGRRIDFVKDSCITCGLCVTACPAGAIESPLVSPAGLRAQVEAVVEASEAVGIVFTCARSTTPVTAAGWQEVAVPCSGMVPGTWPIAAILLGAAAATIRPCGQGGCPIGHDDRAADAVAFARAVAEAAGLRPDVVPDNQGALPAMRPRRPAALVDPFGVHGPAEVLLAIAALGESIRVEAPSSPLGVVDIDAEACTLCTMCAETCPTGALAHGFGDGMMELSFDAGLCTACAQCLPRCPERERGAISLRNLSDSQAVGAGRVVVNETATVACQSCGRPVGPVAALDRIAQLLGEGHAATADYLASRCMDCRGVS